MNLPKLVLLLHVPLYLERGGLSLSWFPNVKTDPSSPGPFLLRDATILKMAAKGSPDAE